MGLIFKAFIGKYLTVIELVIVGLLIAGFGMQTVRLASAKTDLANLKASVAHDREVQTKAALDEAEANSKETFRRLQAQQENQLAQDAELKLARDAAASNAADADRVRKQSDVAAGQWRARLADSPTREDLEAASTAIDVLTDLFGRADHRASELAEAADASRAAGLKCERDYDALTEGQNK